MKDEMRGFSRRTRGDSITRSAAERDDRPVPAGAVTTACQDACPTRAIVFGDLNNPGEVVRDFKTGPRHYAPRRPQHPPTHDVTWPT